MATMGRATNRVGIRIRNLADEDRGPVEDALIACGAFTADEIRVALEMVQEGIAGGYLVPALEVDGIVRAYGCVGKAALTQSTWYLYWICVHPSYQRAGLGTELQAHIERLVRDNSGERLVLETSGRADYARTRRFYQQAGFAEAGRIPDFYKPGDDCVVYCKLLEP